VISSHHHRDVRLGGAIVLLCLVALSLTLVSREPGPIGLLLVSGLLLLIPFLAAFFRGEFDPFEPVYLWAALYGYIYVFKPAGRIVSGAGFTYSAASLDKALAISIFGLLVFYVSYYSAAGRNLARHLPVMRGYMDARKLRGCGWFFVLLGAAGLWEYMSISGGWRVFWSKPHGFGGRIDLTTAYVYQLPEFMIAGFFILCQERFSRGLLRLRDIIVLFVASLGGVGIYSVIWGRRTFIAWVALTLPMLYYFGKRQRPRVTTLMAMGTVLFAIMLLVPIYRSYWHLGANFDEMLALNPTEVATVSALGQGDEFDTYLAEVGLVPDSIEYDYFFVYSDVFFHWIPRSIWKDKPAVLNRHFAEFLGKSRIGAGSAESILGDFWAQLGWIGVVIGMLASGILWRAFYEYYRGSPQNLLAHLLYAVALPNMFSYIAQAPWNAFWKWLPILLPSAVFAFWYARAKAPLRVATGRIGVYARRQEQQGDLVPTLPA